MQKIGSQTRETLDEAGYKFLGYLGDDKTTIVLEANGEPEQKEIWFLNDDHAGYTVEFHGKGFEFARDYKPDRDGLYWLDTPPLSEMVKQEGLTPIHQMTAREFKALPDDIRFLYPSREKSWNPSHSNYWMCEILHHVSQGGLLPSRVWNSMSSQEQSTVIFHCTAWHTNKPPIEG